MGFSLDASSEDEIVVVLRHGIRMDDVESQWLDSTETPWNPPLSDAGILQAKETAQTLSALGIRRVICSPFLRCLETAALVMESLGLPHSACTIDCCVAEVMDTRILVRGDGHGRVAAPAAEQLSLGTLLADAHGILAARGIRIADEAAVADGELPPPGETVSEARRRYRKFFASLMGRAEEGGSGGGGADGAGSPDGSREPSGVLVVTHGEAVGETVSMLVPGSTVYEVVPCGRVVLSRGVAPDDGSESQTGKGDSPAEEPDSSGSGSGPCPGWSIRSSDGVSWLTDPEEGRAD